MSSEEDDENLPREGDDLKTKKYKYTVCKLLGKGGYGAVFEVRRSDNTRFAIKCETKTARKKVLPMDLKVLKGAEFIRSRHFCRLEDKGRVDGKFKFLVMKLVGTNLWDLRVTRPAMRFNLNTSLKLAEQSLISIEELHRLGYLHRDIKPGNFAMGKAEYGEEHTVFMLDFKLCRRYCDMEKDLRLPRAMAPFRGTTRYASIAALENKEQSRKDDIESWMYMIVEWTGGGLPWRKEKGPDSREEVLRQKKLCRTDQEFSARFLKQCPKKEFARILSYVDEMTYCSIPDYQYVYYCVQHACRMNQIKPTDPLEWDLQNEYHGPINPPGNGCPIYFSDREYRCARGQLGKKKKSEVVVNTPQTPQTPQNQPKDPSHNTSTNNSAKKGSGLSGPENSTREKREAAFKNAKLSNGLKDSSWKDEDDDHLVTIRAAGAPVQHRKGSQETPKTPEQNVSLREVTKPAADKDIDNNLVDKEKDRKRPPEKDTKGPVPSEPLL